MTGASIALLSACGLLTLPQLDIDYPKYAEVIDGNASGPGSLIRKRALDVYELEYFIAPNHKAIAQSRSGAWAWTRDQPSVEAAIDRALELCRNGNGSQERKQPCKLVNIDSYWGSEIPRG